MVFAWCFFDLWMKGLFVYMFSIPSNFIFSRNLFRSFPFRTSEWAILRGTKFRGISIFFRGITKTVPSIFRGIFSERNFDGNPRTNTHIHFTYHVWLKGTQEWEFFWLRFWILYCFIVSYVKILRFCKKNFLIGPVLEEVRFFRVVLRLRRMKKNFELGQENIFLFFYLWTLYMS